MNQLTQYGRKWTRDETILALGLYFQIPFAKISSRNPEIRDILKPIYTARADRFHNSGFTLSKDEFLSLAAG